MAYNKTNWTDNVTPIDASNMNKIEDALADMDAQFNATNIGQVRSMDDLVAAMQTTSLYQVILFNAGGDLRSVLSKGAFSTASFGMASRNAVDQNDYLIRSTSIIVCGRFDDSGNVTTACQFTGTAL